MNTNRQDELLMELLKGERDVISFLDSVFGFLYRCTDFYHVRDEAGGRIGFQAGAARNVVLKMFERYERQASNDVQFRALSSVATSEASVPAAVEEVEISCGTPAITRSTPPKKVDKSETFNGDDRSSYRWSQTIKDVDVRCNVQPDVRKAGHLRVGIEPLHLKVEALSNEGWTVLVDHSFPHRVNKSDCFWSLVPGEHVHVSLEKNEERWWDRLFTTDPPINTRTIDTTVASSELDQADQMKIEELLRKQQSGNPPLSPGEASLDDESYQFQVKPL